MARDQAAGLVNSCRGRVLACTFLDPGKFLLYSVRRRYVTEPLSKQNWRARFLGGSKSGLRQKVGKFKF